MEMINWEGIQPSRIRVLIKRVINKIRGRQDIYRLISKGMVVGTNFFCGDECAFDDSFCYLIKIGNNVTLSNRVQLITHDASLHRMINRTKLGRIVIDDSVFIGARSLIMPGVHIGEGAVIAAGSLVTRDVPSGEVWGGYPAKKISNRRDLEEKFMKSDYKLFTEEYLSEVSLEKHEEIIKELEKNKRCFIV